MADNFAMNRRRKALAVKRTKVSIPGSVKFPSGYRGAWQARGQNILRKAYGEDYMDKAQQTGHPNYAPKINPKTKVQYPFWK